MSELNVYHHELRPDEYDEFYLKYEADKVIAEKDKEIAELKCQVNGLQNRSDLWHYNAVEEHKKFVQVDQQITELKKQVNDYAQGLYVIQAKAEKELRHHKYKRCLAMRNMCRYAQYWYSYLMEYESCKIRPNNIDFRKYNKKYHFYIRWRKRWLELAEKFKHNNEVNNA